MVQEQTAATKVRIIVSATRQYSLYTYRLNDKNLVYHNDHSLTCSVPFIALLPSGCVDACRGKVVGDTADGSSTANDSTFPTDRYCKYCWLLSANYDSLKSEDDAVYHMKAKYVHRKLLIRYYF